MLGVQPALGRGFTPEEISPNSRVVVISDRLWKRRFGGDRAILQRPIVARGHAVLGHRRHAARFLVSRQERGYLAALRVHRADTDAAGTIDPGRRPAEARRDRSLERSEDMTRVAAELTRQFPDVQHGLDRARRAASRAAHRRRAAGAAGARSARSRSCSSSPARTSRTCCWRARRRGSGSSPSGRRSAPAARGSSGSCSPKASCCRAAGGVGGLLLAWWALHLLRAVVAERLPIQRLELVGIDGWVLAFTLGASRALRPGLRSSFPRSRRRSPA